MPAARACNAGPATGRFLLASARHRGFGAAAADPRMAYTAAPWITGSRLVLNSACSSRRAQGPPRSKRCVRGSPHRPVSRVSLIPRDQAYAEPCAARASPPPASAPIRCPMSGCPIRMDPDPAAIERVAVAARQWPGVDAVQADLQWYRRLIAGGTRLRCRCWRFPPNLGPGVSRAHGGRGAGRASPTRWTC
jgi:hypothetical protein